MSSTLPFFMYATTPSRMGMTSHRAASAGLWASGHTDKGTQRRARGERARVACGRLHKGHTGGPEVRAQAASGRGFSRVNLKEDAEVRKLVGPDMWVRATRNVMGSKV